MARGDLLHQPGRRPYVEGKHNGVDFDELAADLAYAGFGSVRVVEAIEETQHAHGWPLVVLGCLVRKGERPPVLVGPICALSSARVGTVKPALAKPAWRHRPVTPRRRPKRRSGPDRAVATAPDALAPGAGRHR